MSRLIAFGCSNTYGDSLPDNHKLPFNSQSSKYAWPEVLANKLDRKCVNLGECAASNKKICYNIHNFDLDKDDTVVILWTYYNRSCILHEDPEKIVRIIHSDLRIKNHPFISSYIPRKIIKTYYQFFENEYESWYDQYCRINLANKYLDSKNIKTVNLLTIDTLQTGLMTPNWNTVHLHKLDMPKFQKIDRALDNVHPGIKSHEAIAAEILEYI